MLTLFPRQHFACSVGKLDIHSKSIDGAANQILCAGVQEVITRQRWLLTLEVKNILAANMAKDLMCIIRLSSVNCFDIDHVNWELQEALMKSFTGFEHSRPTKCINIAFN